MSDDAESGKWLKVKATMPRNQKVCGLSDAAFRLHFSVSCWCADEVTDGYFKAHVPASMPRAPYGKKLTDAIAEIVTAGLWIPTEDGYRVNDYLKYNMSRAQYEAKKAAGKLGGQRSGEARRGRSEAPPEAPASAPARPKPKQNTSRPPAPPEHEYEYERSKSDPPPKDLTRSPELVPLTEAEEAAISDDLGEKALRILADDSQAKVLKPHTWPELQGVVRRFVELTGTESSLLPYEHDPGVQGVVVLLARYDLARLLDVLPRVVGTDWWREKPARPLSHLTPAVVDKALAEDAELARVEAERERRRRRPAAPRKATPPPLSPAEMLDCARAAMGAVGG